MMFLFLLSVLLMQQPDCQYDERCGAGMCLMWEHTRFVCEPKQYTMAVWDRACLTKIELTEDSKMEAPIVDGKPDMAKVILSHPRVTFNKDCWRYEIRNH